jgi:hypothetical protein
MGALAGLAVLGVIIFRTPEVAAAIKPSASPPMQWLAVERPHPAFELTLPESDGALTYAIRRHSLGGGRKDIITIGGPGRSDRAMAIEVYRPGAEIGSLAEAAAEITAHTAEFHRVGPIRNLPPLETKFGSMALFDFTIRPAGATGRCAGFVRAYNNPKVQIAGFYCLAKDVQIDREQIACALDRFTLLSAGGDPKISAVFAQAEVKRTFCGQRSPLLAATPKRAFPQAPAPLKLRGKIAGN